MDASQHVQTGALLTHGNLHDECANGLGNDVGGEAKMSSSRDEAAACNDGMVALPPKGAVLPVVGSDVDLQSVSSEESSGGVDTNAAFSSKDGADQSTSKEFCSHSGSLPSFKEVGECAAPKVFSRPVAGSARLSAALAVDGFTPIAIDYEGNRHSSWHHVLELDLRLESTLRRIVLTHNVIFVHIAPPCGTSSRARERPVPTSAWGPLCRARERPVPTSAWGPVPLRSVEHPWGLPHLQGRDAYRVKQANFLYEQVALFCRFLSDHGVKWSVENPRRSYMWELGPFIELLDVATFYDFDACMHGGSRDKRTSFLSSLDLSDLCLDCDGNHWHAEWGVTEDGTFATANEAEYPTLLCQHVSLILLSYAQSQGFLTNDKFAFIQGKAKTDATVQLQSRKKMPPIMSEFARVFEVNGTDVQFVFDAKNCLSSSLAGVPAGSKKLRVQRKQVGGVSRVFYLFGEYRTEQQFVDEPLLLQQPFDQFCDVPDCVIRLLFFMLVEGSLTLAKYRLNKIKEWKQWSLQLRHKEKELHEAMDHKVSKVLEHKNILLLERIAESFDWPDKNLCKDVSEGFPLVGTPEQTGIFPPEVNIPTMSVAQLDEESRILKPMLWDKVAKGEFDVDTWNATVEEATQKSWLDGPHSWEQLEEMFDGEWTPARRFGIIRSGKLRVIDDFSENGTNSAYACQEKLDLRTLDHLTWCAVQMANSIWKTREVDFVLSTGERMKGRVHSGWNKSDIGGLLTKTVDLKSAYKQFAIAPADRKREVIVVKAGVDSQPMGFISSVLPFGAAAAVMSFNRVSRLLWRIFIKAGVLCGSYFDDFPILDAGVTSDSASSTIRAVCRLLGFKCSEDKNLEFAEKTTMLGVVFDTSKVSEAKCIISNRSE